MSTKKARHEHMSGLACADFTPGQSPSPKTFKHFTFHKRHAVKLIIWINRMNSCLYFLSDYCDKLFCPLGHKAEAQPTAKYQRNRQNCQMSKQSNTVRSIHRRTQGKSAFVRIRIRIYEYRIYFPQKYHVAFKRNLNQYI